MWNAFKCFWFIIIIIIVVVVVFSTVAATEVVDSMITRSRTG